MFHRVRRIEKYIPKVFDVLPADELVDYEWLRARLDIGKETIRCALNALIVEKRVLAFAGGERNRKVFRRVL